MGSNRNKYLNSGLTDLMELLKIDDKTQKQILAAEIDMSHKNDPPDSFSIKPKSQRDEGACFTNKQEKTMEYEEKLKTYEPDEAELINMFRPVFIPKSDWGHPHMNGEGRKLPTKHGRIIATKPPAKRRYVQRDEDAIDNFMETSLRSGLISPIDSPTTSALHVVYKNGKPRIVSDLRAINAQNAGDFNNGSVIPIRQLTGTIQEGSPRSQDQMEITSRSYQ